jgi:hypothetical protein
MALTDLARAKADSTAALRNDNQIGLFWRELW